MKFKYDGKPFAANKGDCMVVCEKGDPTAVACFQTTDAAIEDANARNERAKALGSTARYTALYPRSHGEAIVNK